MKKTLLNIIQVFVLFLGLVHLVNAQCPDFSGLTEADMEVQVIESSCTVLGGEPTGGEVLALSPSPCPLGSTIYYSENFNTFTTEVPDYSQRNPVTILARCQCDEDSSVVGPVGFTITDPGECPTCLITGVTVTNISSCINVGDDENGRNDVFTADITITYEDIPPSGELSISTNNDFIRIELAGLDPNSHTISGVFFEADGEDISVRATINGAWRCDFRVEEPIGRAPVNCSECAISDITLINTTGCINEDEDTDDDNDFYLADITVEYSLPPATGTLELFTDFAVLSRSVSQLSGTSHTFTDVQMQSNGNPSGLSARFSDGDNCSFFVEIDNSPPCSTDPQCEIADIDLVLTSGCNNGGLDMDAGNDFYEGEIIIYTARHPGQGTIELTGSITSSIVVDPIIDQYVLTDQTFNVIGDSIIITVAFSEAASCHRQFSFGRFDTCSEEDSNCPDFSGLTEADMEVQVIESSCTVLGGEPTGGEVLALSPSPCPLGSTIYYSENFNAFTTEIPDYSQRNPVTILARCQCDEDSSVAGPVGFTITILGSVQIA